MRKSLRAIRNSVRKDINYKEKHSKINALFREFILGGQDGLVNVLGVILGIAVAINDVKIVIIAGLAACFAESFSMAAVAYTSVKAHEDYYQSQKKQENVEIKKVPKIERQEIYDIYYKKGFRGKLLDGIVKHIVSNKKLWVNSMMVDELGLSNEFISPLKSGLVVGLAAIIGSIIPLISFFLVPLITIKTAMILSIIVSAIGLFITGAIEGKLTVGHWLKKGTQLTLIGMTAAFIGFLVGKIIGV